MRHWLMLLLSNRRRNMAALAVRDHDVLAKAELVIARTERLIAEYRIAEARIRKGKRA